MSIFTDIRESAEGRELSLRWYRERVGQLGKLKARQVIRQGKEDATARIRPTYGMLNLFHYRPTKAERLPYYDIFPLVIPIKRLNDGFLGINFHYLSIPLRLKLLEKVQPRAKEGIQMGWTRVARLRYIKPCIKRYLKSHVGSRFLKIEENDFAVACMLPIHTFKKAPYRSVHAQSRKMR